MLKINTSSFPQFLTNKVTLIAFTLLVHCNAAFASVTPIVASDDQKPIESAITTLLTQYHYAPKALDANMSERIFDQYIKDLDPQKVYFLQSDIAKFAKYKTELGKLLGKGELTPSFELFNLLLERIDEQTQKIVEFVQTEKFDFSKKDSIMIDREHAEFAKTDKELTEIWQLRVKSDLVSFMLTDLDLEAAKEKLIKRYKSRLKRLTQNSARDVFQLYMNAVAESFDPHSSYFSPRASENFNIQMSLSLQGIGAVLRQEDDVVTVAEVVTGGPADLSGQLHVSDEIVGVAQGDDGEFEDIVGMRLDDAVDKIRGKRGTVVRLQVMSGKSKSAPMQVVRIVRDTIKLDKQAAQSEIQEVTENSNNLKLGIIKLPTFYSDFEGARKGEKDFRSTTHDVEALLVDLMKKNIDGLVIDLRGNGGGSLKEVVDLSGLFIGEHPIVQVADRKNNIKIEVSSIKKPIYEGPMVVLVDRLSASASEIFAAAMQDHGRALVVGNTTYGKGTVQTVIPLDDILRKIENPGQLKLTIAKFYRANGESTQHKGVVPDLKIPSIISDKMLGESTKTTALAYDEIKPAPSFNTTKPAFKNYLKELQKRHELRLQNDEALKIFQQQVTDALALWNTKTFSLNLDVRKKEQDTLEETSLTRENALRKIYHLPLITKEDIKKDKDYEKEFDDNKSKEKPDVALKETLKILDDLIQLIQADKKVENNKTAIAKTQKAA